VGVVLKPVEVKRLYGVGVKARKDLIGFYYLMLNELLFKLLISVLVYFIILFSKNTIYLSNFLINLYEVTWVQSRE
jgi:hypothetical protein